MILLGFKVLWQPFFEKKYEGIPLIGQVPIKKALYLGIKGIETVIGVQATLIVVNPIEVRGKFIILLKIMTSFA